MGIVAVSEAVRTERRRRAGRGDVVGRAGEASPGRGSRLGGGDECDLRDRAARYMLDAEELAALTELDELDFLLSE
jgi:hypothetical protein